MDNEGEITVLNDSAQELLGLPDDSVGRRVDDIGLDPAVRDFLLSESKRARRRDLHPHRVLALNRRRHPAVGTASVR